MLRFNLRRGRALVVSASIAVAACGGGGDSGGGSTPAFEPLNQWTFPTGTRIDVASLNLFPFGVADSITYDRKVAGVVNGTVIRSTTSPTGSSLFVVTESDSTSSSGPDQSSYVVATYFGELHVQLNNPFGTNDVPPGLRVSVGMLEEYVAPLYPVDTTRMLEVQGDLEADIDADGRSDSFRFVYTQVFKGFESISILGSTREVARLTSTVSLTLRGTRGGADIVTLESEDTYFAPGIGLVRRDSGGITENGTIVYPAYSIEARTATVGGISYP